VHALVQGVILGILTGGVYALMASGQTLIFGIMKVVNLAQGAMVIMAAYLAYGLFTRFGLDPFLAIPVTTVIMFGLGVGVEMLFLRPLRREDRSELSLLVTFAVALLIEGVLSVTAGTTFRSINTGYANSSWTVAGYQITVVRFWAFILSLVALGFGLGAATAAAAGSVYGLLYPFYSGSHYDLISRLLSIVVLGGLGSVGGAVIAAVIVSTSSAIVAVTISPAWSEMTFFVILILVLLIRPQGLFGNVNRGAI